MLFCKKLHRLSRLLLKNTYRTFKGNLSAYQTSAVGLPVVHHHGYACPWPLEHRFKMAKFTMVMKYLLEDSIVKKEQVIVPEIASYELVTCIHTPIYIQQFFNGTIPKKEMRRTGFLWSEGVVERCRLEVGGTVLAAEIALERGLASSTAGGTHHAFPSHGSGFCMLNDLAIAAQYLLDQGKVKNVMIIDLDVHQGDGTAFIFQKQPQVFTLSLHCGKNFPLKKQKSDFDIELDAGIEDDAYLHVINEYLPWVLLSFKPDLVLYDAGVDPHKDDQLGKFNLSDQGLYKRDYRVMEMILKCGYPCATVVGGGYDSDVHILGKRHTIIHRAAVKIWENLSL